MRDIMEFIHYMRYVIIFVLLMFVVLHSGGHMIFTAVIAAGYIVFTVYRNLHKGGGE